jgi:hypothetical protein
MLRCPQTANLQAHDEDTLNCRRNAHIEGCGNLHRDEAAVSTSRSTGDIDCLDIEALLSCPHANPKVLSDTSMPGIQTSDWHWKGQLPSLIAQSLRPFESIFCASAAEKHELKNPSIKIPGVHHSQERSL